MHTTNCNVPFANVNAAKMLRWVRALWPLIFLVPLGLFAGRLCWINIIDPAYHSLIWLHERLLLLLATFAVLSVSFAAYRFVRVQDNLRLLLSFRSETPKDIARIFSEAAEVQRVSARLDFIDVPTRFCFTIFSGPSIIISRGFAEGLSAEQLAMVAQHEVLHVQRRDPWRSIAWHLFFAGLVLPGFEAPEMLLHLRREHAVDTAVVNQTHNAPAYQELLRHCSKRRDRAYGAICTTGVGLHSQARDMDQAAPTYLWERAFPAMVSVTTLALVLFSHSIFMKTLPYLQAHHC